MSFTGAKCPYCGALSSLNESLLRHLTVYDWGNCGNCGQFLKITLDKTQKNISATERYTSVIYFGLLRSYLLRKDLPYSEVPISENVCEELKKIMIGIKVNTFPDPANPKGKAFKNEDSKNWVINNILPKLVPIYSDYPAQISRMMVSLGFDMLLSPYTIQCSHCGLLIPKTRENNCPICLNGKIPPPPQE